MVCFGLVLFFVAFLKQLFIYLLTRSILLFINFQTNTEGRNKEHMIEGNKVNIANIIIPLALS